MWEKPINDFQRTVCASSSCPVIRRHSKDYYCLKVILIIAHLICIVSCFQVMKLFRLFWLWNSFWVGGNNTVIRDWRDGSLAKTMCCFCRGLSHQNPHSVLQMSLTPDPEIWCTHTLLTLQALHVCGTDIHMQGKQS